MDVKELQERQSWSLMKKIDHSLGVIDQFIGNTNDQYVAFSGGKDSTVLLNLARIVKKDMVGCFINTGNEYPDIVKFVRNTPNIDIVYPDIKPKEVLDKFGFPLISKETANKIYHIKYKPDSVVAKRALGFIKRTNFNDNISNKWKFLISEFFSTSSECCKYLKHKPGYKYELKTGRKPILGNMADESIRRKTDYIRIGSCNSFSENNEKSKPLSIWTEKDIWDYIKMQKLPISEIYYKGATRTGCMFCGFGCQFKNDNRLKLVYDLYPKAYNMFMNYTNNGITYREALRKVLCVNGLYLPDELPNDLFTL